MVLSLSNTTTVVLLDTVYKAHTPINCERQENLIIQLQIIAVLLTYCYCTVTT